MVCRIIKKGGNKKFKMCEDYDVDIEENNYSQNLINVVQELKILLLKKGDEYGDTYTIVFQLLKILFSDKKKDNNFILSENDLESLLAIVRILDKLCRFVHGHKDDIWQDIAGYAILEITKQNQKK